MTTRGKGRNLHYVEVVGPVEGGRKMLVRDVMGTHYEVTAARLKGTPPPETGENWIIERNEGTWRLTAMVNPPSVPTPHIIGPSPVTNLAQQLLVALAALGIVIDDTALPAPAAPGVDPGPSGPTPGPDPP